MAVQVAVALAAMLLRNSVQLPEIKISETPNFFFVFHTPIFERVKSHTRLNYFFLDFFTKKIVET